MESVTKKRKRKRHIWKNFKKEITKQKEKKNRKKKKKKKRKKCTSIKHKKKEKKKKSKKVTENNRNYLLVLEHKTYYDLWESHTHFLNL